MIRRMAISILLVAPVAWGAEWSGRCDLVSGIAQAIMTAHQQGLPMSMVVHAVEEASSDRAIGDYVTRLVIRAYAQPRYATELSKIEEIREFRDRAYVECATISTMMQRQ